MSTRALCAHSDAYLDESILESSLPDERAELRCLAAARLELCELQLRIERIAGRPRRSFLPGFEHTPRWAPPGPPP